MRVIYVAPDGRSGTLDEPRLDAATERHRVALPPPDVIDGDPVRRLARETAASGMVIEVAAGCPNRRELRLMRRALRLRRPVWLFWPEEGIVECATAERLASYRRHSLLTRFYRYIARPCARIASIPSRLRFVLRDIPPREIPNWVVRRLEGIPRLQPLFRLYYMWHETPTRELPRRAIQRGGRLLHRLVMGRPASSVTDTVAEAKSTSQNPDLPPMVRHAHRLGAVRQARRTAKVVPFPQFASLPDSRHPIHGCGVYLRTDFWAPIQSGGSYGHTCYVAKELAAVTETFVCFMANRFPLLDEYGLRQVVMLPPSATCNEDDIAMASQHYFNLLRPAFEELQPAYIYERLCIGNHAGALLSAAFRVPYILEYNGSEISMRRSFEGAGYVYEDEYLEAEALAFEQATLISVVSAEIRKTLVGRGVDPAKILVNPNGVDLDAYAPAARDERDAIRAAIGFTPSDRVIGFTGTFGGWHGIDVLSEAIAPICRHALRPKFLLIGDGHFKGLVDGAVATHRLENQVHAAGRVPQTQGARLLKACDIYVSPHSSHMVDSKFFGSPTKVFEYMALGGGIVASDLEQIGQVLSPGLTPEEAAAGPSVSDERAVLCDPGDVNQFVQGVLALVEQPEVTRALGRNARVAAVNHYSWTRHVANLWQFLSGDMTAADISPDLRRKAKWGGASTSERVVAAVMTKSETAPAPAEPLRLVATGDAYKDQIQRQWNQDPAGSHYVLAASPHTKQWFLEAEQHRYGPYAPWMFETMEFDRHAGEELLEIGGGMGTDLAQFAIHGARVTDVDLSSGHLKLAKENFRVRGLEGRFILQDAEALEFADNTFDLVYSNGVLHHTPNTRKVVSEILRVLKPGGRAIVMVYAENSLHYWRNQFWMIGLREGQLGKYSMGEIMSRTVERSDNAAAHPLVKVYTRERLRQLFDGFVDIEILQRQLMADEVPRFLAKIPRRALGRLMGWNLVLKARKPLIH